MTNDEISAIKRDYDRDGFVILPGYLHGPALEELRERATRLTADLFARKRKGEGLNPRSKRRRAGQQKGNIDLGNIFKSLNRHDAWFDNELTAGRHVPLIEALVGDKLLPSSAAWFTKIPGSKGEIAPHRDAIGRPPGGQAGATLWIALDPADPENGCLHYGRGSHRIQYAPGTPFGEFVVDPATAVAAIVQPGDAVIHSDLTVHWSEGNPTERPRRAVSFFYYGASKETPKPVDRALQ
ncbi:MAG: phytanoyl-CoA dioxygenase family protein [Gammaproteobacteria bacterium]|nr:phytanoyl-CoA dioxygenase family protein [Gammaproteobacteria bacterium]